jgi:hypothetical protein
VLDIWPSVERFDVIFSVGAGPFMLTCCQARQLARYGLISFSVMPHYMYETCAFQVSKSLGHLVSGGATRQGNLRGR